MRHFIGIVVLLVAVMGCDLSKYADSNQGSGNANSNGAKPTPTVDEMRTPPPADANKEGVAAGKDFTAALRKWEGKYPSDVKLLDYGEMQSRLKKIMEGDFGDMKAHFNTETPIEIENNIFKAQGCEAHNCGGNEYYIYVDLNTANVNVYHIKDGRTKTYFEQSKINLPRKFADDMGTE